MNTRNSKAILFGVLIALICAIWCTPLTEPYYVASRQSYAYHLPGCSAANRIYSYNLVRYDSIQEARSAEKRPCQICNSNSEDTSPTTMLQIGILTGSVAVLIYICMYTKAPEGNRFEYIKEKIWKRDCGVWAWLLATNMFFSPIIFLVATLMRVLQLLEHSRYK